MTNAITMRQHDRWNGAEGRVWVDERSRFDRLLAPFGDAVWREAALQPGERVLDVGCGAGATTVRAAAAVTPTGHVTGIDLSEPLLALARERAGSAPHVELVAGDAATFPLAPDAYDAIVSRFGLMLFAEPEQAFAHLGNVLRPNGRVVFSTWAERSANAWTTLPVSAVTAHVPMAEPKPPAAQQEPCAFSLSSPSRIHELCARASLTGVRMKRVETRVWIGRDVTDAVGFFEATAGNLRASLGDQVADRIVGTLRMALAPYAETEGVRLPAAAWIVSGRRER